MTRTRTRTGRASALRAVVRPVLYAVVLAMLGSLVGDAISDRDWPHLVAAVLAALAVGFLYFKEVSGPRRG